MPAEHMVVQLSGVVSTYVDRPTGRRFLLETKGGDLTAVLPFSSQFFWKGSDSRKAVVSPSIATAGKLYGGCETRTMPRPPVVALATKPQLAVRPRS